MVLSDSLNDLSHYSILGIGRVQLDAIEAGELWDDWVELEVTKGAKKATGAVHLIITKAEEGVSVDEHAMVS